MKIKRIITDFLFLLPFLLVFFTVFIVNRDLVNGVITGKYFWFYTSIGVLCVVTLLRVNNEELRIKRFSVLDFFVLLFAGSVLFTSLVIHDASQNTTKLTLFALLAVLYFNFRLFFNKGNTKAERSICFFIIIIGLIEAVWGLRQLYGFTPSQHSLYKITGSFFNPGPYAGYLAVVFPLALQYFLEFRIRNEELGIISDDDSEHVGIKRFYKRYSFFLRTTARWAVARVVPSIACVTCIFILLILPASMSRASWLAAAAGSLVVLAGHYGRGVRDKSYEFRVKYKKTRHRLFFSLSYSVLVLILFLAFAGMYHLKKDSANGRTLMWKIALHAAKKHPLGVGLGNFSGAYGEAQAAYFASGKGTVTEVLVAGSPDYGFNEYLQIAVESGVISLVLFLAIVFFTLRSFIISRKWGAAGSMVSLLVFAFFSYPFSVLPFLIVFVFLLAKGNVKLGIKVENKKRRSFIILHSSFIIFTFLFVVVFCLYRQYPVYGAYKKWNTDKFLYNSGKDVVKSYEELYPLLYDQLQFLFEYAQSLSKTKQYTQSNEILKRAMQISCDPMLHNIMGKNHQALYEYQQAEDCFIKAAHIVPHRLYPFYLLVKLYHEMGLQDKVNEMADIVQTKEPKVQSTAVMEMRQEVEKLRMAKPSPKAIKN